MTNTINFTGDALVLRATDGGVTVSIPIRIQRYGGRKQVVVPLGISAGLNAVSAPTALQVNLARGHRWLRQIESGTLTWPISRPSQRRRTWTVATSAG